MNINPTTVLNPQAPTRNGIGANTVSAVSTTLTFGRAVPVALSNDVTEEEIRNFLERTVTPRFPAGYSVTRGTGVWKGASELTFSVTVIYPAGCSETRDATIKLEEIRAAYKARFAQDTTLRTDTPVQLSIDSADAPPVDKAPATIPSPFPQTPALGGWADVHCLGCIVRAYVKPQDLWPAFGRPGPNHVWAQIADDGPGRWLRLAEGK